MTILTNMKSENREKPSYTFLRLMVEFSEFDKKTRCYGTDTPLYEAEIHTIKAIEENEGIHATGLAEILGVTKGAVSQILNRLEAKGMIVKNVDSKNLSKLSLKLTSKGKTAYLNHQKLHHDYDELFEAALDGATEHDREFLKRFLQSLELKFNEHVEDQSNSLD